MFCSTLTIHWWDEWTLILLACSSFLERVLTSVSHRQPIQVSSRPRGHYIHVPDRAGAECPSNIRGQRGLTQSLLTVRNVQHQERILGLRSP